MRLDTRVLIGFLVELNMRQCGLNGTKLLDGQILIINGFNALGAGAWQGD